MGGRNVKEEAARIDPEPGCSSHLDSHAVSIQPCLLKNAHAVNEVRIVRHRRRRDSSPFGLEALSTAACRTVRPW